MTVHQRATELWSGRTDGFLWMHRNLILLLKYLPIRFFYFIADIVVGFYMIFSHRACLAIFHYFKYLFNKSELSSLFHTYLSFREFGHVIIDRFAAYAGKKFNFIINNKQIFDIIMASNKSCIILSAHIGNYEMAGYSLPSQRNMYVLLFEGEKETIIKNRTLQFSKNNIHLIFEKPDMSHIFDVYSILSNRGVLNLFADRNITSIKTIDGSILGKPANLPIGPFKLAESVQNVDVLTMFVVKEKYLTYNIYIKKLNGKTKEDYATAYATELSNILKMYPHQWFNFYDFWHK